MEQEIEALRAKFNEMTVRENPDYFLGMNIEYIDRGIIRLSASSYATTLAKRYASVVDGRDAPSLPSDASLVKAYKRALDREHILPAERVAQYGSKVGSLIYPVPCARPDCAVTVGLLARALTFPPKNSSGAPTTVFATLQRLQTRGSLSTVARGDGSSPTPTRIGPSFTPPLVTA